jgi:hypothetical protein
MFFLMEKLSPLPDSVPQSNEKSQGALIGRGIAREQSVQRGSNGICPPIFARTNPLADVLAFIQSGNPLSTNQRANGTVIPIFPLQNA